MCDVRVSQSTSETVTSEPSSRRYSGGWPRRESLGFSWRSWRASRDARAVSRRERKGLKCQHLSATGHSSASDTTAHRGERRGRGGHCTNYTAGTGQTLRRGTSGSPGRLDSAAQVSEQPIAPRQNSVDRPSPQVLREATAGLLLLGALILRILSTLCGGRLRGSSSWPASRVRK